MGTWQHDTGDHICDGALDEASAFIRKACEAYMQDLGRQPTIDEICRCLMLAINFETTNFEAELEEKLITKIRPSFKKRPKKQKFSPGDVIAIDLNDQYQAIGIISRQFLIIDFIDHPIDGAISLNEIISSKTFRLLDGIDSTPIEEWRWPIVGHVGLNNLSPVLQHYRVANQITCNEIQGPNGFIEVSAEFRPAKPGESNNYPELGVLPEGQVIEALRKHFNLL